MSKNHPDYFGHSEVDKSPWSFINRWLFILICGGVLVVLGIQFAPLFMERSSQQLRLAALELEVQKETQLRDRNVCLVKALKHDSELASYYARDRLNLLKEGEMIYRFPPSKPH